MRRRVILNRDSYGSSNFLGNGFFLRRESNFPWPFSAKWSRMGSEGGSLPRSYSSFCFSISETIKHGSHAQASFWSIVLLKRFAIVNSGMSCYRSQIYRRPTHDNHAQILESKQGVVTLNGAELGDTRGGCDQEFQREIEQMASRASRLRMYDEFAGRGVDSAGSRRL